MMYKAKVTVCYEGSKLQNAGLNCDGIFKFCEDVRMVGGECIIVFGE